MFTLFKPNAPEKTPVATTPVAETLPTDYAKLALDAGFGGYYAVQRECEKQARLARFRAFLAENGICIYDFKKVRKYLRRLCPSDRQQVWCGFDGNILDADLTNDSWAKRHYDRIGGYTKPIPEVPLMTLAKIRAEFPQAVGYVSDFLEVPKGDPFLAVMFEGAFFIIERWDEPGFRM